MSSTTITPLEVRLARATVVHLGISRLYSLGNYENVKFEVGVSVPTDARVEDIFRELMGILSALKPLTIPSCRGDYLRALKKGEDQRSNYEKDNFENWQTEMEEYAHAKELRLQAVKALDTLGGNTQFRDAKTTWGDPDDEQF